MIQNDEADRFSMEEETALNQTFLNNKSLARPENEKEFEDELEYGANVRLPERLQKYKFLTSFAGSTWNKYVH